MPDPTFTIAPARTPEDLAAIAELFRAYETSLPIDLAYQDFEAELATLPGKYAPPKGELFLAHNAQGKPIGCVALRPFEAEGCCEMKRLYVSPEGRGMGLGKALVNTVVAEATKIGYQEMRLDTLPTMTEAIAVYTKQGFEKTPAYYNTPIANTVFMRRSLINKSQSDL